MRSPKYQLRMDQGLYDALVKAGSTRVREALKKAFPVVPGTTEERTAVVPVNDAVLPEGMPVVPEPAKAVVPRPKITAPVLPDEGAVVPRWKAKLEADRDRLVSTKAKVV